MKHIATYIINNEDGVSGSQTYELEHTTLNIAEAMQSLYGIVGKGWMTYTDTHCVVHTVPFEAHMHNDVYMWTLLVAPYLKYAVRANTTIFIPPAYSEIAPMQAIPSAATAPYGGMMGGKPENSDEDLFFTLWQRASVAETGKARRRWA